MSTDSEPLAHEPHGLYDGGALGDARASNSGAGNLEMLAVVNLLKESGIPSCVVGVHPLGYYGAGRVANFWELCVPDDKMSEASQLFISSPLYEPWPVNPPYPQSINHTFPRFHLIGVHFVFYLVPSSDRLIKCDEEYCEKSSSGLPYPKLECLAQSLLDRQRWVDLEDLVDGMNLGEEWGEEHLDLDRTSNVEYARRKNEIIRATIPETPFSELMEMNEHPVALRPIWQEIIATKKRRIGVEMDKDLQETRFFPVGAEDPRLQKRTNY